MVELGNDIIIARNMRRQSYSKYTGYSVGVSLKAKNGKRYGGCNIENYGIMSICAERTAFAKAISEGEREFESITVIGGNVNQDAIKTLPCGYCRQFMREFCDEDFKIYVVYGEKIEEYTLKELLPYSFNMNE